MRVVVTRPLASGQKTAKLLRALGHQPVLLPLTQPVHFTQMAKEALSKQPAALAVTSAQAIRVLTEGDTLTAQSLDTPLFAVGEASAQAGRDAGFRNVIAGKSDGVALAQLIVETLPPDKSLLYLAGKPREAGFEDRLSSLNMPFETAEIYEMQAIDWHQAQLQNLLADAPIDAVLLYSAEAARRFFALMETEAVSVSLDHCKFICISTKVVSHIPEAFRHAALASATPSEAEIFALLDTKAGT